MEDWIFKNLGWLCFVAIAASLALIVWIGVSVDDRNKNCRLSCKPNVGVVFGPDNGTKQCVCLPKAYYPVEATQ